MRKYSLFAIFTIVLAGVLHAQKDTMDITSSFYSFHPTTGEMGYRVNEDGKPYEIEYLIHFFHVMEYAEQLPCKVYGIGITMSIDSCYHYQSVGPKIEGDSTYWAILGKSNGFHKLKDDRVHLDFEIVDSRGLSFDPTKGFGPDYYTRFEYFHYKFHPVVQNIVSTKIKDEVDTVVPVYEFYFDSAYTFDASHPIVVGGLMPDMADYKCQYHMAFCLETTSDEALYDPNITRKTLQMIFPLIGAHPTGDYYLEKGTQYTTLHPSSWGCTSPNAPVLGPFYPIIGLRCTTPKAVRWTAIGDDTARFEWQLHDEAENFIVEVEDLIANTTTHDTLPSWQNYYTVHGLDTNTDCLQLRVQKSTRYTMKYYDTVVYSPWYELPLLGHLPAPPDTTQPIDTTQPVDTNQGILMAQGLQFSLQPNPVHDKAEVQLAAPAGEGCTATLTDLSGRELQRIVVPPATQTLTIDLTTLPAGTYLLTLATPTATSTQRLVKGL